MFNFFLIHLKLGFIALIALKLGFIALTALPVESKNRKACAKDPSSNLDLDLLHFQWDQRIERHGAKTAVFMSLFLCSFYDALLMSL